MSIVSTECYGYNDENGFFKEVILDLMVWVQGLYTIPISFKGIVMVMGMSLGNGLEAQYVLSIDLKHKVYLLDLLYYNMYIYFICLITCFFFVSTLQGIHT